MDTRAAVAVAAGEPLKVETVQLDGPKAGEVLVEIKATGICHTDAYTLSGDALQGSRATVVYSRDDPVIPSGSFETLPDSLDVRPVNRGGHCGFIDSPDRGSWLDRFLIAHFERELAR